MVYRYIKASVGLGLCPAHLRVGAAAPPYPSARELRWSASPLCGASRGACALTGRRSAGAAAAPAGGQELWTETEEYRPRANERRLCLTLARSVGSL